MSRIISGSCSPSGGHTGRGSLLRASALPCDRVSLNSMSYSYEDKSSDHRRMRAEACGEVDL